MNPHVGFDDGTLDLLPFATVVATSDAALVVANARWRQLTELSEEDSRGDRWMRLLDSSDCEKFSDWVGGLDEDGTVSYRDWRLTVRATGRWTRWAAVRYQVGSRTMVMMSVVDIEADRKLEETLRHRASHDGLTGLANRAEFLELTAQALSRRDTGVSVVYVDLVGFKHVNDSGGHLLGDRVLAAAAGRLRGVVRSEDVLARVGGDEFAVLCDSPDGPDLAHALARRIRAAFNSPIEVDGTRWKAGATTGIAVSTGRESAEVLLAAADRAMYRAKRADKNALEGPPGAPGT